MADIEQHQAIGNHSPRRAIPRPIPLQPLAHNHHDALQQDFEDPRAAWPAALNGQHDGRLDAMARDQPGMLQDRDRRHIYDGMVDYRPQPPPGPPVPHAIADVEIVQGILAREQPNVLENQQRDILDFAPQHAPPFPAQAVFPDPFAHRIHAPGQPAAENLRRLAIRLLRHPDSQVDLVSMEPGAAGLCRVVIVLELADVL